MKDEQTFAIVFNLSAGCNSCLWTSTPKEVIHVKRDFQPVPSHRISIRSLWARGTANVFDGIKAENCHPSKTTVTLNQQSSIHKKVMMPI